MLNFPPKSTIDGVAVSRLKAILKSIEANKSDLNAICLSENTHSHCENAISVEILKAMGAFDPVTFELTDIGIALAGSASRKKLSREKATSMLDDFLASVERHNQTPTRIHDITKVWVYGSFIKGAASVGDIDIAMEVRKSHRLGDQCIVEAEDEIYPLYFNDDSTILVDRARKITRKILFPERRPAQLSLSSHTMILVDSAEPCALYFTIEEGRIAKPELLDKHPEATTRSETMLDRSGYPDETELLSKKLRLTPMSPYWLTGLYPVWRGIKLRTFDAQMIPEIRDINSIVLQRDLTVEDTLIQDFMPIDAEMDDGTQSNRCTLEADSAEFTITRSINEQADNAVEYCICLSIQSLTRRRRSPTANNTFDACFLAAALLAGDIEMLATRRSTPIRVKVEASIGSENRAYEITRLARMMSDHPALLMEDTREAV